jgi:hypothetical protein
VTSSGFTPEVCRTHGRGLKARHWRDSSSRNGPPGPLWTADGPDGRPQDWCGRRLATNLRSASGHGMTGAMLADDQWALLSAAVRHQSDAETLLESSPDQSWHLAGYVTECIRKASLTKEAYRKALGHEQGRDFDALFELVSAMDPGALRLHISGWGNVGTRLHEWDARHRYEVRNAHAKQARELVRETSGHHDRTLTALWLSQPFDPGAL